MLKTIKQIVHKSKYIFSSSTVLMFHHVTDTPIVKKSILMNTNRFLSVIDSFDCFTDVRSAVENYKDKKIAITFDDALLDVYTIAYKELTERNIPFTVFVATDLLNQDGYISSKQLLEMVKNPLVNIGSHCISHTPMKGKTFESQKEELCNSKNTLEDLIQKKVTEIAYPYGQYDANTLKLLKQNDLYDYGFLAAGGPVNRLTVSNKMILPRLRVDDVVFDQSMSLLRYAYK